MATEVSFWPSQLSRDYPKVDFSFLQPVAAKGTCPTTTAPFTPDETLFFPSDGACYPFLIGWEGGNFLKLAGLKKHVVDCWFTEHAQ